MNAHTKEILDQFINALQLSIDSTLAVSMLSKLEDGHLCFSHRITDDPRLKLMEKLLPGHWASVDNDRSGNFEELYQIYDFEKLDLPFITSFLILTRLDKKNIKALSQQDARFLPLCEKLGFKEPGDSLASLEEFSVFLRAKMNQKNITIQKLAELSGITPLSINKFRKGHDIKLSNLLKIMTALGHRIKID